MINVALMIFDLDGTLVDSLEDIASSVNHTMTGLELHPLSRDQIRSFVGDGIRTLLRRSLETQMTVDEGALDDALAMYVDHHDQHCVDSTVVYPGVHEVLSHFASKKKAVVSNKSERFTRRILDALGLSRHFDVILGGDSLAVKKPDPAILFHVATTLKANARQSVMIGDGPQDMSCGRSAGMLTCGVTYGYRNQSALNEADHVIHNLLELKGLFQ